jgi:EAL domain-containing protein (putative c-di-GMP-specific phosphodiesterase class I)
MVSIWHDAAQAFGVGFPAPLQGLLFWVTASLVVHVCQRLVEHTAFSADPPSRRVSASHASLGIGCIVWALDVVGLFLYEELAHHAVALDLVPALSGLIIMAVSTRLTIPTLSTSARKLHIAMAGACLAAGMLLAHFTITQDLVRSFATVNWTAIVLAAAIALCLATWTSIRHRAVKMSVLTPHLLRRSWEEKAVCGAAILLLHWLLVNTFGLLSVPAGDTAHNSALLVCVLVFGTALAVEQLRNMHFDAGRQQLLRRGLSMMRASNMAHNPERDMQLSLIADRLHDLLQPDRLALHFQPIVDLRQPGVQFEALLRVKDPALGPLNPEIFLLACELQGRTGDVDRMILRNALDCLAAWREQGLLQITISVNVAPSTLLATGFCDWLRAELAQRALPHHALRLEMTEHAVIALGAPMVDALQALGTLGIAVVMDDFGTGYSSLGMLADLPIAGVKCDRLFVQQLASDARRQSLLRHIGALTREFGLSVVVEGVETADELQAVAAAGLHAIQGYLYSKPMASASVPAWYANEMQPRRKALQALLSHTTRAAAGSAAAAPVLSASRASGPDFLHSVHPSHS